MEGETSFLIPSTDSSILSEKDYVKQIILVLSENTARGRSLLKNSLTHWRHWVILAMIN